MAKELAGMKIGFALTGSFCTLDKVFPVMQELADLGAEVHPVLSERVQNVDTKFGEAALWRDTLRKLGCRPPMLTIPQAEPIGPTSCLDVLVIAPCSGNTMAKLANGITDGVVLMAAKAHLRNGKPLVIALASNDALGINAKNLGLMLNMQNIYFVPFGQDSPISKPNSLVFDSSLVVDTVKSALKGVQIQPLLLGRPRDEAASVQNGQSKNNSQKSC